MDESLWRIDEGGLPGCPAGTVVSLVQDGDSARVFRNGGQIGTLHAGTTEQFSSPDGLSITLVNQIEGWRAVLSRAIPSTTAAASATGAQPPRVNETQDQWVRTRAPKPGPESGWGQPGVMAAQPTTANTQVVVRTYPGKQPEAFAAFQRDAAQMAQAGWFPVAQQYVPGQWSCGAFAVAVVLFLVLVGIFVFIYMLIVSPDGALTVTYEYRGPTRPTQQPPLAAPDTGLVGRLSQLDQAKAAGLISDEEYAARRAGILDTV